MVTALGFRVHSSKRDVTFVSFHGRLCRFMVVLTSGLSSELMDSFDGQFDGHESRGQFYKH